MAKKKTRKGPAEGSKGRKHIDDAIRAQPGGDAIVKRMAKARERTRQRAAKKKKS